MTGRVTAGFLLGICLLSVMPAWAEESLLPAYFDVAGVSRGDVLNLRAGPGTRYPVVGRLAHDARSIPVIAFDDSRRWARVRNGEGMAWASLSYLRRQPGQPDEHLPPRLHCGGTEPFWGLRIGRREARFEQPGQPAEVLEKRWEGTAVGMLPHDFGLLLEGKEVAIRAVVQRGQCSDGMSDRLYGFSIRMLVESDDGPPRLYAGCCGLP